MIQRKPINRLGVNGPVEVKTHPWLKDFPWQDLWDRRIKSPFLPPVFPYIPFLTPSQFCFRKKIILIRRILRRSGRTRMMRSSRRMYNCWDATLSRPSSMAIILTISWLHWVRILHSLRPMRCSMQLRLERYLGLLGNHQWRHQAHPANPMDLNTCSNRN